MADPQNSGVSLLVDGRELDEGLVAYIDQLVVDDDLHRPGMFSITLNDPRRNLIRRTGLRAGAVVEISIVGLGNAENGPLIKGDVVTVECDYDEIVRQVVVRGYSPAHRLHRGRRTRVFQDATDSDIVKQVAGEAGLEVGDIEETGEVHEHITQANQTDWEFLASRAKPLGLDLTMTNGALRFGRRSASDEAPSEADADADPSALDPRNLIFGLNLRKFHGTISAAAQVASVEVRGWDPDRKQPVTASVPAGSGAAGIKAADPAGLAGKFGDQGFVDVARPVATDSEAESIATALAERIGSAFAEAEGVAIGSTALRAGVAVRISRAGEEFDGAYVLSHVRHCVDRDGYRTHFTVSGRHDRSLLGLISASSNGSGGSASPRAAAAVAGLVRGVVSDVADPDELGRVKVKLPWLADEFSSAWAPVMQLGAGPDSGTFFLPAVGDEVLVGFEHGQVDRPIVIGGLFNGLDKPPTYAHFLDDGRVVGKAIVSRQGHELSFHDADDKSGLTIHVVSSSRVPVVSIGLNATDNKLVIQSEGNVDVQAEGEINLTGKKITVQAQGDLVLKGAMVKIN
jgi:phage protein D/phage baseplate assembly protein gpV